MCQYIYLGNELIAKVGSSLALEDKPGYTGHVEDKAIGLTYMQQRYYDPVIGRFYSNDPVDMLGHMRRGNPTMGFNRYAYANNNPYKYTDPDGQFIAALIPFIPEAVALAKATLFVGTATAAGYAGNKMLQEAANEPAKPDPESGKELDPADKGGELTKAGRAGQKHGSREGSAFPPATGNAESKNNQGQGILEEIVNNPESTTTEGNRFGGTNVTAPDGRGAAFDAEGKFQGFLEPKKNEQQ